MTLKELEQHIAATEIRALPLGPVTACAMNGRISLCFEFRAPLARWQSHLVRFPAELCGAGEDLAYSAALELARFGFRVDGSQAAERAAESMAARAAETAEAAAPLCPTCGAYFDTSFFECRGRVYGVAV